MSFLSGEGWILLSTFGFYTLFQNGDALPGLVADKPVCLKSLSFLSASAV